MLRRYGVWHIRLIFRRESMIRYFTYVFVFIFFIQSSNGQDTLAKLNIDVKVLNDKGEGVRKAEIEIKNINGEIIQEKKTKKNGRYRFKGIEMTTGKYFLSAKHEEYGGNEITFSIDSVDLELEINIPKLDASLNAETNQGKKLPQQRSLSEKETLKFEKNFFEYESNIKQMKLEIDSLKTVVRGYEKKQTMPNLSREILDLIQIPDFQHRIELQNGTIVSGALLEESDSTLTIKTQIGTLVLKKEMVIRMEEVEKPGPEVIFLDDPFIDYYPDKQIFSGSIKNIGEIRADFVRVVGKLFDQTTSNAGEDSIFVKGKRVVYESNVVADTALDPGQVAKYKLTVPIKRGFKPEYNIMDIKWEQTK